MIFTGIQYSVPWNVTRNTMIISYFLKIIACCGKFFELLSSQVFCPPFHIRIFSTVPLLVHVTLQLPHHQINYCYLSTRTLQASVFADGTAQKTNRNIVIYALMKGSWPSPLGLKMSPPLDLGLDFQLHSWTWICQSHSVVLFLKKKLYKRGKKQADNTDLCFLKKMLISHQRYFEKICEV